MSKCNLKAVAANCRAQDVMALERFAAAHEAFLEHTNDLVKTLGFCPAARRVVAAVHELAELVAAARKASVEQRLKILKGQDE